MLYHDNSTKSRHQPDCTITQICYDIFSKQTEDIMKDYSFGNFLRELRERSSLSQYQLGSLVGLSNKAVSKWENLDRENIKRTKNG